jgi:hypothetical protein
MGKIILKTLSMLQHTAKRIHEYFGLERLQHTAKMIPKYFEPGRACHGTQPPFGGILQDNCQGS